MRRIRRFAALIGFGIACVTCSDPGSSPTGQQDPRPIALPELVVSNAVPGSTDGPAGAAGPAEVAWLSLPPGILAGATTVRIRNATTGGPATDEIPMIGGGFDPVPVIAGDGDELELVFSWPDGDVAVAIVRVPPRRPPSVVRTSPPKDRTDVALDVRPYVIFSEPIDPGTANTESVKLTTGGTAVSGSVRLHPEQPWLVEFVSADPLRAATQYVFEIGTAVRDLQGDALGASTSVTFTTGVSALPGISLTVSNVTTGGAFDPDGLLIAIDGDQTTFIELNDTVRIDGLPGGTHEVELLDVASNCTAAGGVARTLSVPAGTSGRVAFDLVCVPPPELASIRIVFADAPGREPTRLGSSIVAMNADGSGRVQLTSGEYNDYGPDVSPDGSRIVFMRDGLRDPTWWLSETHVMNADGTGVARLVPAPTYDPAWSPDGRSIAFVGVGGHWGGWIHVMGADGSGRTALTRPDEFPGVEQGWPAWSPDGTRIAFTRVELGSFGQRLSIGVMQADGAGATVLLQGDPWGPDGPVWSPDGSRIAFTDGGSGPSDPSRLGVMNADGSGVATLLESDDWLNLHDWSADGELLLFTKNVRSSSPGRQDIYLLRIRDGTVIRLTAAAGMHWTPAFWPENPSVPVMR
jgi:hypothetical protein